MLYSVCTGLRACVFGDAEVLNAAVSNLLVGQLGIFLLDVRLAPRSATRCVANARIDARVRIVWGLVVEVWVLR